MPLEKASGEATKRKGHYFGLTKKKSIETKFGQTLGNHGYLKTLYDNLINEIGT